MGKYKSYKRQVLECMKALVERGFVQGTGGNVSMLVPGGKAIAVTPSQREYASMTPDDICIVDFNLKQLRRFKHRRPLFNRNTRSVNFQFNHNSSALCPFFAPARHPLRRLF